MCYSRDGEVAEGGRRYADWQVCESLLTISDHSYKEELSNFPDIYKSARPTDRHEKDREASFNVSMSTM